MNMYMVLALFLLHIKKVFYLEVKLALFLRSMMDMVVYIFNDSILECAT